VRPEITRLSSWVKFAVWVTQATGARCTPRTRCWPPSCARRARCTRGTCWWCVPQHTHDLAMSPSPRLPLRLLHCPCVSLTVSLSPCLLHCPCVSLTVSLSPCLLHCPCVSLTVSLSPCLSGEEGQQAVARQARPLQLRPAHRKHTRPVAPRARGVPMVLQTGKGRVAG
jgi:hypothetical protein